VIVESSSDRPNYLYTPWTVDYEGLKFKSNSILFSRMVDELTRGQFLGDVPGDKKYAIFKIADYIYRRKVIRN